MPTSWLLERWGSIYLNLTLFFYWISHLSSVQHLVHWAMLAMVYTFTLPTSDQRINVALSDCRSWSRDVFSHIPWKYLNRRYFFFILFHFSFYFWRYADLTPSRTHTFGKNYFFFFLIQMKTQISPSSWL